MRDPVLVAMTVLLVSGGSAQAQSPTTDTKANKVVVTGRAVDEEGKLLRSVGTVIGRMEALQTKEALETEKSVADGRFRVELPLAVAKTGESQQGILIAAKGRQSLFLAYYPRLSEPSVDVGDLALLIGTTLIGQVRDAAGKPLAGVRVTSQDMINAYMMLRSGVNVTQRGAAVSDARGMFRLPCAPKNTVKLVFWKEGYYQQELQPVSQATPINVVMPAGGFVEGQATDASGKGVCATLTIAYEAGSSMSQPGHTAADGKFKASLAFPGRYRLIQYERPDQGIPRLVSPILEGPQQGVLVRPSGSGADAGGCFLRVEATAKKSGKAVTGVEVAFFNWSGHANIGNLLLHNPRHHAKTDASGTVRLPPWGRKGQALVLAKGHAAAALVFEGTGTREKPEVVQVEMEPESVIEGRVVDESGKPVAGSKVWTVLIEGFSSMSYGHVPASAVETDKDGKFRLDGLRGGTLALQAFLQGRPAPPATNVEVGAGETKSDITIKMTQGLKVSGLLKGDRPRAGWQVQLQPDQRMQMSQRGTAVFMGHNFFEPQTIAADGKFAFEGLRTGKYALLLLQPFHDRCRQPLRFELGTIAAIAKEQSLEFDTSKFQTARIHGRVQLSGARGLEERLIVVAVANVDNDRDPMRFNRVRETSRVALVDLLGRFDLRVTPGRYDIRAFDVNSCVEVFKLDETLELAAGAEVQRELPIKAQVVRLKLQPAGDKPMARVTQLRIERKDRQWRRGSMANDPRFFLRIASVHSGIPIQPGQSSIELFAQPGEYQVQVLDRSTYLRDTQSFRQEPVGKQDIEVKEGEENEFTIPVPEATPTAELEGKADNDK